MAESKSFSRSEVSLHSSKKDCWVVIHGKVYDVTAFLEEHPGGEEALLEGAAKGDATADFDDVGHSSTATAMMTAYLIGDLKTGADSGAGSSKSVKEEKKGKPVSAKASQQNQESSSDFLKYIPFFIVCLAFFAWYYLNKLKV